MIYDTCENIVLSNKAVNDFKNFEFELIRYFSITTDLDPDSFESMSDKEITELHKAISHVASLLGASSRGYRVLSNIGSDGGQEVPHLHFHIFAGEKIGKMVA